MPARISGTPLVEVVSPPRQPDDEHDDELDDVRGGRPRGCGPVSTAERDIGSERKRSISPFFRSSAESERGDEAAEDHRLDDDPRDQEVDVVEARRRDRAAEDVDEEQDEHDRLHREADEQVGLPRDALDASIREDRHVRQRGRTRPTFGRTPASPPRCPRPLRPVSFRKTRRASGAASRCRRSRSRRRRGAARRRRSRRARSTAAVRAPSSRRRATGSLADPRRERGDARVGRVGSARACISSRSPPTCSFSSSGRPSAITTPWSMTAIRSASRSASSRYCVVSSTVVPAARRAPRSRPRARCRLRMSSPVVGSSRNRTGGRATSAAARSSRRRMPPE